MLAFFSFSATLGVVLLAFSHLTITEVESAPQYYSEWQGGGTHDWWWVPQWPWWPSTKDTKSNPRKITVSGSIRFKGVAPESFPPNSQLKMELTDVSFVDDGLKSLTESLVDLSGYAKGTTLRYSITSSSDASDGDLLGVSAVLNVGWIPKGTSPFREWIRNGDYHTDTSFSFTVEKGVNTYEKDIELVHYRY